MIKASSGGYGHVDNCRLVVFDDCSVEFPLSLVVSGELKT